MAKEKNPVDRRLREVAQSRAELTAEIKRLERALKNPERLMDNPHLLPAPSVPRFRNTVRPGTAAPSAAPPPPAPVEAPASHAPSSRAVVSGNETFARLFSSTRFLGAPGLRHERRVQRNRAFAIVFGSVLVIYLAYKFFR